MDQEFLAAHDVEPWTGPRSVPLWLPLPEYAGLMAHDVDRRRTTPGWSPGRSPRPPATPSLWLRDDAGRDGHRLAREEEARSSTAWHERS